MVDDLQRFCTLHFGAPEHMILCFTLVLFILFGAVADISEHGMFRDTGMACFVVIRGHFVHA